MDKCGIYAIENRVNGKRYVGSAVQIQRRWGVHRNQLKKGTHHSTILQSAWKKYGAAAFVLIVIEECAQDELITREQFHLDQRPAYNVSPTAGSNKGTTRTLEQRARMSAAMKGVAHPNAVGQQFSPERRANISSALKGKVNIDRRGKPRSEETKLKISEAQKGKPRPYARGERSEEVKQKMSLAMKGNQNGLGAKHSAEAVERSRQGSLGLKRSPESREKMRRSRLAFLAKAA